VAKSKKKSTIAPLKGPRVLIYDIETAPILAHVWGLWENNVALSQIVSDWHVLSWSAKWLDDPPNKVMYMDQRNSKRVEDDKDILKGIWDLLNQADIVITQNGKSFDQKKLNARFIMSGFQPPSSYKHIDTKQIASKHFGFSSNKLEYMTDKLCVKYKKSKHKKFPGHEMWVECLAGNIEAWKEMEQYNKYDVLSLEELYRKLIPWENTINFNAYHDELDNVCKCGSTTFVKNGFYYTSAGKYQKHRCKQCGAEHRDKENLFSKDKRASLKMSPPRT
jgi:hypothetical protein